MILEISKKYRAEPFQNIYFGTDCPILHESLPHTYITIFLITISITNFFKKKIQKLICILVYDWF